MLVQQISFRTPCLVSQARSCAPWRFHWWAYGSLCGNSTRGGWQTPSICSRWCRTCLQYARDISLSAHRNRQNRHRENGRSDRLPRREFCSQLELYGLCRSGGLGSDAQAWELLLECQDALHRLESHWSMSRQLLSSSATIYLWIGSGCPFQFCRLWQGFRNSFRTEPSPSWLSLVSVCFLKDGYSLLQFLAKQNRSYLVGYPVDYSFIYVTFMSQSKCPESL